MNNSFGKVMVVFVTAASLGFAAFAMSLVSGGPNWKSEIESPDFVADFVVTTATTPEKKTYTLKSRQTDQQIGQGAVPAELVIKAREKQVAEAKAEDARLAGEIAKIKPMIEEIKAFIPPDQAGLVARTLAMDKALGKINEQIQATAAEYIAKSASIKQIELTTKERREEGFRLKNQLELLRTDLYAAQAQQKVLEDELVEVQENLKRLERRELQLKKQVEPYAVGEGN